MGKPFSALVMLAVLSTPAFAQVRPEDCRPVLPVVDQVAEAVLPQDVMTPRAGPIAPAAARRFVGLPLLPLLLAGAGAVCIIACGGDDDGGGSVSPG